MRRIRRARRKRTCPKRRLVKSPGKVLPKITVIPTDRNARRFCSGYLNRAVAMQQPNDVASAIRHSHVFLGTGHEQNERKTWGVIVLCGIMMVVEIVGGSLFGSLALVADGLHTVSYTHLRAHETRHDLVCRLLLEKKKKKKKKQQITLHTKKIQQPKKHNKPKK